MDSTEQDTTAPAGANISDETNVGTTSTADNSAHKPSSAKDADATWDSYKNSDGSFDFDRVFKEFAAERDRADGLRKKLEDYTAPKENVFHASDLDIPIAPEEQQEMDDLVTSFNEYGITKEQAQKMFKKIGGIGAQR